MDDVTPSEVCCRLHLLAGRLTRRAFPFDRAAIPRNGIYLLFERGEHGHGGDRIVRVGTHTGQEQLPSRLGQHFLAENKDRSIFRKNIGRALLNRDNDPFLPSWNLDLTTRLARERHLESVDLEYQLKIESAVSRYMRENLSFVVFEVGTKAERLALEAGLIGAISLCRQCGPSSAWLGLHSPVQKIRDSGLWLVNQLYKAPVTLVDLTPLQRDHTSAADPGV